MLDFPFFEMRGLDKLSPLSLPPCGGKGHLTTLLEELSAVRVLKRPRLEDPPGAVWSAGAETPRGAVRSPVLK